ncbi:hypothetical protein HZ326_10248 [Fusarium oxysporum f. sp. albedinis]|nr:hypothetical protein HZ326_10248 [Fusarium oxysporum f. sp. albedinis]
MLTARKSRRHRNKLSLDHSDGNTCKPTTELTVPIVEGHPLPNLSATDPNMSGREKHCMLCEVYQGSQHECQKTMGIIGEGLYVHPLRDFNPWKLTRCQCHDYHYIIQVKPSTPLRPATEQLLRPG